MLVYLKYNYQNVSWEDQRLFLKKASANIVKNLFWDKKEQL